MTTITHYDARGSRYAQTDARGNTTTYFYDTLNRQIGTVTAEGVGSYQSYDENGRRRNSMVSPYMEQSVSANIHIAPISRSVNVCSATVYDRMGRRAQSVNQLGHIINFGYDGLGRMITTTRYLDGQPVTTITHYDARGGRYAQTDARGNTTTYFYDNLNRQIATVTAEGVGSYQTYDENCRLTATTNSLNLMNSRTGKNPLFQRTIWNICPVWDG